MTTAAYELIDWQVADGVARLTLKRPPLNVVNIAMLREMCAALEAGARDTSLRALVLRAEGKLFSAGVDVADHTADKVGVMIPLFDEVCVALASFPAPTLAVVHGHALGGGCELALACDLIVAAENANFGQPEIKLATFPPVAALRLPGVVGYRRAAEMVFTGANLGAAEAARIGLVNRAVPAAELETTAGQYVEQLRALSAAALRACKRALRLGADAAWSHVPAAERLYLQDLMSTADAHEGVNAFIEKRAPVWRNE